MSKNNKEPVHKQVKVNVDGIVVEVLPDTKYKIEIDVSGFKHIITGYPSGKIRKNYIKLAEGDSVIVEMSPEYDMEIGRVVWKNNKYRPGSPAWATTVNSTANAVAPKATPITREKTAVAKKSGKAEVKKEVKPETKVKK